MLLTFMLVKLSGESNDNTFTTFTQSLAFFLKKSKKRKKITISGCAT